MKDLERTIVKAEEITMKRGDGKEYPVSSVKDNILPDTELQFIGTRSRQTGTGYRNCLYRICGTDDCLVIEENQYDGFTGRFYDTAYIQRGFFRLAAGARSGVPYGCTAAWLPDPVSISRRDGTRRGTNFLDGEDLAD